MYSLLLGIHHDCNIMINRILNGIATIVRVERAKNVLAIRPIHRIVVWWIVIAIL